MEGNIIKTKTDFPSDIMLLLQQTHDEALQRNDFSTIHWTKLRDEHVALHSHLLLLPDKLTHNVMVPIGSKALIRGNIVHTNEILVCLGDGWFVKQSAKEAAEICKRRIKLCDEMLKDLERERDLLSSRKQLPDETDCFGAESRKELLEEYDEEKETKWRAEHRQKEKKYRQKLSELRKKDQTKIEDEESLWTRLDELELQEELEEELDRMQAEREDLGEDGESEGDSGDNETDEDEVEIDPNTIENLILQDRLGGNGLIRQKMEISENVASDQASNNITSNLETQIQTEKPDTLKSSNRRVSFVEEKILNPSDSDDSESSTENFRIEFSHTHVDDEKKVLKLSDNCAIQTPGDIHKYIKKIMIESGPKSILKNKSIEENLQRMQWHVHSDSIPIVTEESEELPLSTYQHNSIEEIERPMVFGDIHEHSAEEKFKAPEPPSKNRQTSRFKASRLVAKR